MGSLGYIELPEGFYKLRGLEFKVFGFRVVEIRCLGVQVERFRAFRGSKVRGLGF